MLQETYQFSTLSKWKETGKSLYFDLSITLLDGRIPKNRIRRRGYSKTNRRTIQKLKPSGSVYKQAEEQGPGNIVSLNYKVNGEELYVESKVIRSFRLNLLQAKLSNERRITTMEEDNIRERILKKQMILFERQLDKILELTDPSLSKEEKRELLRESFNPEKEETLEKIRSESLCEEIQNS